MYDEKGNTVGVNKREIPLNKEWYNSIYTFTKNPIRFIPSIHNKTFKLLQYHFNMHNVNIEIKNYSKYYNKHISTNKVWVSNPEIKYYNKKAIITVYIYNRSYNQYTKQLNLFDFTFSDVNMIRTNYHELSKIRQFFFNNLLKAHETDRFLSIQKIYKKTFEWLKIDKYMKVEQYKTNIRQLIEKEKVNILKGINLLKNERYNYLLNFFKKELLYFKLKQKIIFNLFKFKELSLIPLINFLQKMYNKKIQLNIVILKNYYLSSNLLSQIVVSKIRNIRNRGRGNNVINNALNKRSIPNLSSNRLPRIQKIFMGMNNIILNKLKIDSNNDILNEFLLANKSSKVWSSEYIDGLALKNIENKSLAGISIKLSGRLTKRYKAQRAIKYLSYKGTLKNVYSAHKGFSSTLSRGYANINVEKTMIDSKVRIGAFGVTGWVASY